jgi:hypothetical protein
MNKRTQTEGQVGYPDRKGEGEPKIARESDQPIVLRDGRADHVRTDGSLGEGAGRNTKPAKETLTGRGGSDNQCKPHCGE